MLGRFLLDLIKEHNAARRDSLATPSHPVPTARSEGPIHQSIDLDGVHFLVQSLHGWFLANRYDRYLGYAMLRYGECCEIEQQSLLSLLGPGDNVVEVGANVGIHTIGLAKAVGPQGTVVAVEPQPAIFRVLCANLALNSLQNVMTHPCGCGPVREMMSVPLVDYSAATLHNSGSVSLMPPSNGHAVQIVPVDELCENLSALRLLKVDVEGMEHAVLSGAREVIRKFRPILYVENDRVEKSAALIELIQSLGYRMWWHTPALFNPENYFSVQDNEFPNVVSFNMLCLPQEKLAAFDVSSLHEVVETLPHPLQMHGCG